MTRFIRNPRGEEAFSRGRNREAGEGRVEEGRMKGRGGRGVLKEALCHRGRAGPPHVQFVAPRGPEGRVALAAAGQQRKSGLAPISPAVGAAALRGGKQER